MNGKVNLYIVSHTHWDREWYQTFQEFRRRLVFMMDDLIENMENDPEYKYFHMDGQTIVLEDYLKIRPENRERLASLIKDERIIIGPWYVMPDEMLISGESIVRNLQKGFDISRSYGVEPLKCGYAVDIFGHNSQFPQIMKGFGIDSALLYRGIGDFPKDAFIWKGADGSTIFCAKMDRFKTYANFYFGIRQPFTGRQFDKEELLKHLENLVNFHLPAAISNNLLMLDGVDHIEIEPQLPDLIKYLNEKNGNIHLIHSKLEDYIEAQEEFAGNLDTIQGELYTIGRVGPTNKINKNVLSSMVHLKQMNNRCETLLTRWAEPFDAAAERLGHAGNRQFLEEAWVYLMKNHPHDSICGCSITRVHEDNIYRFNQVKDIAEGIVKNCLGNIAENINTAATGIFEENDAYCIILFNASQKKFDGFVETDIELPAGSQGNFKIFDNCRVEVPYQILDLQKGTRRRKHVIRRLASTQLVDAYRVVFKAVIPPVGYNTYYYKDFVFSFKDKWDLKKLESNKPVRYTGSMQISHRTWENEYLTVEIMDNGTFNVLNKETGKIYRDFLIFEDSADIGDGWKLIKPLRDSRYISIGERTAISIEYDGPMAVGWKIVKTLKLPVRAAPNEVKRINEYDDLEITVYIKMKKASPRLEFEIHVENNIADHRLRVLFPTFINTDVFSTSTPFYLQERKINKGDWSDYWEPETGVAPNQGVVLIRDDQDSLALYNKGLYEVEITDDESHTAALTLFRSFRKEVDMDFAEMALMKREMNFEFALEFGKAKSYEELMLNGESWRTGIRAVYTQAHTGKLPAVSSFLDIRIPYVILSSYKKNADGMEVLRIYNYTVNETKGDVIFPFDIRKAYILNLNEEIVSDLSFCANKLSLELGPGQILTAGVWKI